MAKTHWCPATSKRFWFVAVVAAMRVGPVSAFLVQKAAAGRGSLVLDSLRQEPVNFGSRRCRNAAVPSR